MKKSIVAVILLNFSGIFALFLETTYRPNYWRFIEPRLERAYLGTWDISWAGGSTTCARTCCSDKIDVQDFLKNFLPAYSVDKFVLFDVRLEWIQNLNKGFFIGIEALPMRLIKLMRNHYAKIKLIHPGDTYFLIGWTKNYIQTESLDYIDMTIQSGIIFPTSNYACSGDMIVPISTGFNKNWGGFISGSASWGVFDWATFGLAADSKFFAHTHKPSASSVWTIATYLKADHMVRGLSLLLGYSFERTHIRQSNLIDRNVFHLIAEWDGQTHDHPYRPRIQLIYNHTISGKNIIETSMLGGLIAFDVALRY